VSDKLHLQLEMQLFIIREDCSGQKGKEEKRGSAEGGEGPVSFISSATVHEAYWLWHYRNSPFHLTYYLLIYAHHYGRCNLCDE